MKKPNRATTSSAFTSGRSALGRRRFLQTVGLAGTGSLILPKGTLFGANAPNNKLNIALIGVWGRAMAHYNALAAENVVALCDVDEKHLAVAAQKFPDAKHYVDWRKCLDQKDLDAVVCCTTDHTHAFVANWAMNRDLHVYCEKPLANSVEEARIVRATYLKKRHKLATQVGTQRHAFPNFNRVRELVRDGAIGRLEYVSAWGTRKIPKPGYLPAAGDPPPHLHYDLWIGPSPWHPYNPEYFSGRPGGNCLHWNMYWDFGTGQVGDMGSHTMDLAWNALDADLPTTAVAKGDPFNPEVSPVGLEMTWDIPANDWRPAIKLSWFQGGRMPDSPMRAIDLWKVGHGAMFEGDKGTLISGFNNRILVPLGDDADFTYYRPRTKETLLPPLGSFQGEWLNACKGSLKTSCNFDYAGKMIEMMMLGLVAYRTGLKLQYDGATGRITPRKAENDLLYRRKYREGWTLNG